MSKFWIYIAMVCCSAILLTACGDGKQSGKSDAKTNSEITTTMITTTKKARTTAKKTTTETVAVSTEPKIKYYTSAIVCSANSDEPIFSDKQHESIAPASMTKIMTACVALKYMNPDDIVTVGSELGYVQPMSSMCNILPQQQFTLYDLLTGMLLSSGNDAAYTVAVNTARSYSKNADMPDDEAIAYFCDLMNKLAANLEMTNTHFSTPDGWDHPQQLTTVHDLMKLAKYATNFEEIQEITMLAEKTVTAKTGETFEWKNSNLLLHEESNYYCPYAIGTKTGSTVLAGNCLISEFYVNATNYFIIVAGCPTDESRFEATLDLFNEYCNKRAE